MASLSVGSVASGLVVGRHRAHLLAIWWVLFVSSLNVSSSWSSYLRVIHASVIAADEK